MKAFAIFDGGGVLGAALAGCLAAAQEQGVEFAGYGGTSAGSLVAALAAAGYSGREIQEILVETEFTTLLNRKGERVDAFKAEAARIAEGLESGGAVTALRTLWRLRRLVGTLARGFGVDDGGDLKAFLREKVVAKRTDLRGYADVTFDDLARAGGLPLKVVASDVTLRRPVIFSADGHGYGASVLDAVRASTCYPFVFQPLTMNGRRLVDGGLSSNLPAFLFHEEYRATGYPVFAFDLTSEESPPRADYRLVDYVRDMLSTALDAGDELLRHVLKDVVHVPVPVPARFDVLNFKIPRAERNELFGIGYEHTAGVLSKLKMLALVRQAGDEVQKQLQARYGRPDP